MMNCFRHPEQKARRVCYECKQPICPACQYRADRHIFCSPECHQKWRTKEETKRERRKPSKSVLQISLLESRLDEITGEHLKLAQKLVQMEQQAQSWTRRLMLLGLISVLALGFLLFAFWYLWVFKQGSVGSSNEAVSVSKYEPEYPMELKDEFFLEPPLLELVPGKLKVEQGRLDLYGRALGGKEVAVLINGREKKRILLSRPEFVFQGLELMEGINLIQVLAEDDKGNQAFSIAQMIEYSEQGSSRVAYTPGLDYTRGSRDFPALALTFDAGGSSGYAERVLEILREQGVKLTIFVTGQFIKEHPHLVRKMVEDGHEIGNHTYSHPHLTTYAQNSHQWTAPGVTREFVQAELLNTAKLFKETTGTQMAPFWRAPYGEHNYEIRRWAEEVGFYHIGWSYSSKRNYDTLDWLVERDNKYYRTSEEIREKLVQLARENAPETTANGAIVLMHLSTERESKFPDLVLEPALQAFSARGLKLVKVSELLPSLVGK